MKAKGIAQFRKCFVAAIVLTFHVSAFAEVIYVNGRSGSDDNPGTVENPLKTLSRAAEMVNRSSEPGPTTIKIAPGAYCLSETILFENPRPYTKENRLVIEATVLPDEPDWKPALMPIILTIMEGAVYGAERHSISLKIEISHVTIRGLKFLGNPKPRSWNYSVFRQGKDLDDLLISQCLFVGDAETIPYNCCICANGHGLVLDHNIFYGCEIPVVFWDAHDGVSKGNTMRYCIVDGANITAVWTCQTAEDFEFHHNVVARSRYLWMRPRSNTVTYRIHDCVVTDVESNSGYGTASELFGPTGPEITFTQENVIRKGTVTLAKIEIPARQLSADVPRDSLHVKPGTLGSDLGAGLFARTNVGNSHAGPSPANPPTLQSIPSIVINEELSLKKVQEGAYVVVHRFPSDSHSMVVEMNDSSLVLVDTPCTAEATKELLDGFEAKLGKRKIIAVNTGFHWDNLGGNEYLVKQGIAVYGSDLTAKLVTEQAVASHAQTIQKLDTPKLKRFADALRNLSFTAPTHLFKIRDGLELDFAGEKLQVYYPGPTHTQDNVVVYFPNRKILFGGCMISGFGEIGNTADADMDAWPQSLGRLKAFDIDRLIPGHGNRMYPALIEENIRMLERANLNRDK